MEKFKMSGTIIAQCNNCECVYEFPETVNLKIAKCTYCKREETLRKLSKDHPIVRQLSGIFVK